MKVWTWSAIDYGLIRDDMESAEDMLPMRFNTSMDAAMASMAKAFREEAEEENEHVTDEEDLMVPVDPQQLDWKDESSNGLQRYRAWCEDREEVLLIYQMDFEEE